MLPRTPYIKPTFKLILESALLGRSILEGFVRWFILALPIFLQWQDVEIADQERIAQLVLCPVVQAKFQVVESLDSTTRGAGGFGSTGV